MQTWHEIDARRSEHGLSRAEMCRQLGISESTVFKGIKNGRKPHPSLRRAAQAYFDRLAESAPERRAEA